VLTGAGCAARRWRGTRQGGSRPHGEIVAQAAPVAPAVWAGAAGPAADNGSPGAPHGLADRVGRGRADASLEAG
jgi:hypothetical protein